MSIAIALWSLELSPGKPVQVVPANDIKISNVALSDVLADNKGRTSLKLSFDKVTPPSDSDDENENENENEENEEPKTQTTVICSLTPGQIEQASTDIVLQEDESYTFELTGKNTLFLTGHYIDQGANQSPGGYDGFDESDTDEEDHDLRYVSSDVEMPPDGLDVDSDASRFEEVEDDEPAKNLKRPRESVSTEDASKASKAEKKSKKQKLEDGKSVAADAGEDKKKKEKKEKKEKAADGTVKELPSGLKIKDSKVGTGPMAKKGQTILMRYIGKLQSGKVFDSNTKGKPFAFRLGQGEVIKGWDEGIAGMQVGGERVLTVPPNLGYGKKGTSGIPGNSTLIFEVKCVQIK